ncbi:hypothetical protein KC644_02840 [Candidatus Berkelbacteria bacterium]|nr:hypothetical protein [Candidatus Berkelbacteria bacterium]
MKDKKTKKLDQLSSNPANSIWLAWEGPEFQYYQKGWFWTFAVLLTATSIAALLFVYDNYSAFAVVVAATILFVQQARIKPKTIKFSVGEDGFYQNEQLFRWEELKSFWIIGEDKDSHLYLETNARWLPVRNISLANVEPTEVRARLGQKLPEQVTRGEQFSEFLARLLKF